MTTRKPRQTRAKVTVDTIIEAGFIAVALHGPSGTTTRHIAEIAGVSVGSLYEYFKNKEEIYDAMNHFFCSGNSGHDYRAYTDDFTVGVRACHRNDFILLVIY